MSPSSRRLDARTRRPHPLSILQLGSEAVPFSKTGGLADVLGALPSALARAGHRVTVVTPRYRGVGAGDHELRLTLPLGGQTFELTTSVRPLGDGATAVLVDCPALYDREALYGQGNRDYPDNAVRFAVLTRAAFEWCIQTGTRPSVVHAHDWQAGLAPVYLKTRFQSHPLLGGVASVFTIHNLAYQGLFPPDVLPSLDLPRDLFRTDGLEFWGKVSFLKGGITFAEFVTTVSETYAQEIRQRELGAGFDGILQTRGDRLVGITNGIDVAQWNPETDPHLPAPYSARDLAGKVAAKQALLAAYRLPEGDEARRRPLVGMISRLVDQKGFDLLEALGDRLIELDANFVVLGTGEPRFEEFWRRMAAAHPGRVGVRIGFDEALAHLVEAGADLFLMPSRFEPCGLNQMYSLRYGTVPVVRATGGLVDTVVNYNARTGRGIGFTFTDYSAEALYDALARALAAFGDPRRWRRIQAAGMARDHSWDRAAQAYVRLYRKAMRAAASVATERLESAS